MPLWRSITSRHEVWTPRRNCCRTRSRSIEQAFQLNEDRYQGGLASEVEVEQARTILETTRAQMVDVGVARAQYRARRGRVGRQGAGGFHAATVAAHHSATAHSGRRTFGRYWKDAPTLPQPNAVWHRRTRRLALPRLLTIRW